MGPHGSFYSVTDPYSAMPIDRDSYKPITGNPRRDTGAGKDEPEDTESEAHDCPEPNAGDGAQSGPDRSGRDTDGGPPAPNGDPSGSTRSPDDTDGDPSDSNGDPEGHHASSGEEESSTGSGGHPRAPSGRKRRVKVTPKDWDALERVSDRLGVGYAKTYRIAFQQLAKRLEQ